MKLPYEQVAVALETLFNQAMSRAPLTDQQIEEYCLTVDALIESMGWTVEEYFEHYIEANWNTGTDVQD